MVYMVTGGSGFLGARIVKQLIENDEEVICFDQSGPTATSQNVIGKELLGQVTFIQGDISDSVKLFDVIQENNIEFIIHTATMLGTMSDLEPSTAIRVNCIGMNNMLEAARLFKLKRVVWTGAVMAIGNLNGYYDGAIGDEAIYKPVSMYSATKALNEFMARHYFKKFGVDNIGIRVPQIMGVTFGPGKWKGSAGMFAELIQKAALNIPVQNKRPEKMSFTYVEDAAAAHIRACEVPITKTRVFNVLSGSYTNDLLAEMITKINPDARVTIENIKGIGYQDPKLDVSAAGTELEWQPEYNLESSLREMMNYYRKEEGIPMF